MAQEKLSTLSLLAAVGVDLVMVVVALAQVAIEQELVILSLLEIHILSRLVLAEQQEQLQ